MTQSSKHPNVARIRKARAWLYVNSQEYCKEYNKPYRPKKFFNSLNVYQQLVDECPISEAECWEDPVLPEDMEAYEAEFEMNSPQVDKQPETLLPLD